MAELPAEPHRSFAGGAGTPTLTWYVPAAYVYFGFQVNGTRFCYADSNGNAAGSTLEDAILQGFFEIVERDAAGIWFYNNLPQPAVGLAAFGDRYINRLVQHYKKVLKRDLIVLDITTDLKVPCFVALSRRTDRLPEDIIMGFGCHLDPHVAIGRALTEINQILFSVLQTNSDGSTRYLYEDPEVRAWLKTVRTKDHAYLRPDPTVPAKTPSDYSVPETDDLLTALEACLGHAHRCGLEVFVFDATRADLGLATVKVLIPGMAHKYRRLGHARLDEVPVKMGWRNYPLPESSKNSWSLI